MVPLLYFNILTEMMKNHEIDKTTADQRTSAQHMASGRCGVNVFCCLQHPKHSKPILTPKSHFARGELCSKRGKETHSPPESKKHEKREMHYYPGSGHLQVPLWRICVNLEGFPSSETRHGLCCCSEKPV